MMNTFMLAGVSSNVGKTTVTMGVLSALCKRGRKVIPFKTGPDYIDPMFHGFVTGKKSTNLDTWMLDEKTTETLFYNKLEPDSVAVIEGVMGLYDGHSIESDIGSSAYLSKVTKAPVFLIIDGRGMAKSAAAMVKGYVDFDKTVKIAGVIINKIATRSHYDLLKEMIEVWTGVPCVGYFPNCPDIVMNSRHLGLIPAEELDGLREQVETAAALAEEYIDLDKILELSAREKEQQIRVDPFEFYEGCYSGLKIGYARDKAFSFYYEDNFAALKKLGVTLVSFSPLEDKALPEGVDGLYLGGGFPEIFGEALEANRDFRKSLKDALKAGLPCFAECGGLMYLTKHIEMLDGKAYEAVGFLEAATKMTKRLKRFGYVNIKANIGDETIDIRGHEFHHSLVEAEEELPTAYRVTKKEKSWRCGFTKNNTLAGYPHIHFYSNPQFLVTLLNYTLKIKNQEA